MYMLSDLPFLYVPIYSIPCRMSHTPRTASIFRRQTQLPEGSSILEVWGTQILLRPQAACTGSMHVILRPTSTACNFTLLHFLQPSCVSWIQTKPKVIFFPANANDDATLQCKTSHPPLLMIDVAQMDSDFGLAQPSPLNIFPAVRSLSSKFCSGLPSDADNCSHPRPTFATDHFYAPVLVSDPPQPPSLVGGRRLDSPTASIQ